MALFDAYGLDDLQEEREGREPLAAMDREWASWEAEPADRDDEPAEDARGGPLPALGDAVACYEILNALDVEAPAAERDLVAPRVRPRARPQDPGPTADLSRALDDANRSRLRSVVLCEQRLSRTDEHGLLLCGASQILESELGRLVVRPALGLGEALVDALAPRRRRPRQALAAWLEAREPAVLGMIGVILLALRDGLERDRPDVAHLVESHFRQPEYANLLRDWRLLWNLDAARTRRNQTVHGAPCPRSLYRDFCELLTGRRSFLAWQADFRWGGRVTRGARCYAVLHAHLTQSYAAGAAPPAPAARGSRASAPGAGSPRPRPVRAEARDAYTTTCYWVQEGSQQFPFQIGKRCAALDRYLATNGAATWTLLMADRPRAARLLPNARESRRAWLEHAVLENGLPFLHVLGVTADGCWPPEAPAVGVLVAGLHRDEATRIARRFGQTELVVGRRGGPAEVVVLPAR